MLVPVVTGTLAGAGIVMGEAMTACTGAPVAPDSGAIVTLLSVIGIAVAPRGLV